MLQTFFFSVSGGVCTECINEKGFSPAGASVRELVWTLRRYLSASWHALCGLALWFFVTPPWRAVLVFGSDLLLIDGSESESESILSQDIFAQEVYSV